MPEMHLEVAKNSNVVHRLGAAKPRLVPTARAALDAARSVFDILLTWHLA